MSEWDYELSGGGHRCQMLKTSDPAVPKTGYGGHPVGARPKRRALTVYQGRQPFTLEVPMLLWRGGGSVEADRIALDNMATSEGNVRTQHPPVVQIRASYPLPIPPALGTQETARWWIEDLVWGDEVRNPPHIGNGCITRKEVTVTLLEWSDDNVVLEGGAHLGMYRVRKPPDTILSICRRHKMDFLQFRQLNPTVRSDGNLRNGGHVRVVNFTKFTVRPGT